MKYITTSLLLVALLITSCQNEDSITNEEILPVPQEAILAAVEGIVSEEFSLYPLFGTQQKLANASVKMMLDGVLLDEVNTDERGRFIFPERVIPIDETYLIVEAPGYHKNVSKLNHIQDDNFNLVGVNMAPKKFQGIEEDDITDEGPYINLTINTDPSLRDYLTPVMYYVTNADNEFIGMKRQFVESYLCHITTLADEPLFLHYYNECSDQVIEIGPFAEDTVIDSYLEGFTFDSKETESARIRAVDCDGVEIAIPDYQKYTQINGLTNWSPNNSNISGFGAPLCIIEQDPIALVGLATQNPRMYGEAEFDLTSGLENLEITVCENDDTYLNYQIGGGDEVVPDLFTYANVLSNGNVLIKLKDPLFPGGVDVSFQVYDVGTGGNAVGDVILNGWPKGIKEVIASGEQINFTITSNDGNFIEGTFDGPVIDPFEAPLGNLTGEFKARIQ